DEGPAQPFSQGTDMFGMREVIEQEGAAAGTAPERAERARKDPETIRVALVQSTSELGTETYDPRDANLERALESIERAAGEDADLVVFGEMYLSGYRTDEWLHKWATTISPPDTHVQSLVKAAAE